MNKKNLRWLVIVVISAFVLVNMYVYIFRPAYTLYQDVQDYRRNIRPFVRAMQKAVNEHQNKKPEQVK